MFPMGAEAATIGSDWVQQDDTIFCSGFIGASHFTNCILNEGE
jgi:hypothetical protein